MQDRIERPNLHTAVQEILRAKILSGELQVGERIIEEKWCQILGISRMPLKLSLVALAEEGLVRIVPRRGAFVNQLSDEDMIELCRIREALEALAIELAIERNDRSQMDALHEAARRYEATYRLFAALPDPERDGSQGSSRFAVLKKEDLDFHMTLMAMSGNKNLHAMMNGGRLQQLTIGLSENSPRRPFPKEISEEHLAIASAVAAGDAAGAKGWMRIHLARAVETVRWRQRNPQRRQGREDA